MDKLHFIDGAGVEAMDS